MRILVTGDFYGGGRVEDMVIKCHYDEIFNDFIPVIREADIAITNLESPLTHSLRAISKTGPAIKSDPALLKALKFAGFNLLTLANNHIMDYGNEGLEETLAHCRNGNMKWVGAGMNYSEASSTCYLQVNGKSIAIINIAENEWSTTAGVHPGAHPLNPVANFYTIQEARKHAGFVLLIVHGGHELYSLPSPRMKETYRFFIDAGADAVIGHHTHYCSGYEYYRDKPIFYSLGNFIFDRPEKRDEKWEQGFAVIINHNGSKTDYELVPYCQSAGKPGIYKLTGADRNKFFENIERLNNIIGDDNKLEESFQVFKKKVGKMYRAFIEPHNLRYLHVFQSRGWLPSFLTKRKKNLLLNLSRCESHREVMVSILND